MRISDWSSDVCSSDLTQVARHPQRPHFCDFVSHAFDDFIPLGGDRHYGEDEAIMGGFASLGGRRTMLIGHEKGHDTATRRRHNFGMGKPEGYRKGIRLKIGRAHV